MPPTILSEAGKAPPRASPVPIEQLPLPPGGSAFLSSLVRLQLMTPESVREFLDQTTSPLAYPQREPAELLCHMAAQEQALQPAQFASSTRQIAVAAQQAINQPVRSQPDNRYGSLSESVTRRANASASCAEITPF